MAIGKIPTQITELNFNVVWAQIPSDHKSAFIGVPQKVKLPSTFLLYKFTDRFIQQEGKITEWWCSVSPFGIDPGLEERLNLARLLGASPAELTRVVAAVTYDWNKMTHLLQARLLMPVYGFWGQCATKYRTLKEPDKAIITGAEKPEEKHMNRFPGYSWQFYIPNLTRSHIREVKRQRVAEII
jgi:hypothetical protein